MGLSFPDRVQAIVTRRRHQPFEERDEPILVSPEEFADILRATPIHERYYEAPGQQEVRVGFWGFRFRVDHHVSDRI